MLEIISPIKDNVLLGVIYRHPKQKYRELLQYLNNKLKKIKQKDNTNRTLQSELAKIWQEQSNY